MTTTTRMTVRPLSPRDFLINQETGEFDWTQINRMALARADGEFGGPGAPVSYVRDAIRHYQDYARDMQHRWRQDRGLPNEYVMMEVPAWGASGDSFSRR
jgi:hypothetical protein